MLVPSQSHVGIRIYATLLSHVSSIKWLGCLRFVVFPMPSVLWPRAAYKTITIREGAVPLKGIYLRIHPKSPKPLLMIQLTEGVVPVLYGSSATELQEAVRPRHSKQPIIRRYIPLCPEMCPENQIPFGLNVNVKTVLMLRYRVV